MTDIRFCRTLDTAFSPLGDVSAQPRETGLLIIVFSVFAFYIKINRILIEIASALAAGSLVSRFHVLNSHI